MLFTTKDFESSSSKSFKKQKINNRSVSTYNALPDDVVVVEVDDEVTP
jgi:hypothetical protein